MPASASNVVNGDWFRLLVLAACAGAALHIDWISDSTGTSGADASHVPYLLGQIHGSPAPIGGVPCCDVLASDYGPLLMTQQWNTNVITPALINPGQTTTEGNQGNHLGVLFAFAFTGNKATTERIRKYILPAPSGTWAANGTYLFNGSPVTGRVVILKTPTGLTGATAPKFVGKRGGVTVSSADIDCASPNTGGVDEVMVKYDTDLGSGAGGPLELEIDAGAGDETGKTIQTLGFYMLANLASPKGIYWTTSSIGGWTTKSHASSDGAPAGAPTYTGQYSDTALASWLSVTKFGNAPRVGWIQTGTNDPLNQAARRADLATIIARRTAQGIAAGAPYSGFVVCSPPDPGPVSSAKYDSFDQDAEWAAQNLGTVQVPVLGIKMRPLLPNTGTMEGDIPGSMNGVHAKLLGSNELGRRVWACIMGTGSNTGRISRAEPRVPGRLNDRIEQVK